MGLTVNLKPSGFQPIGAGELVYQFTESSLSGKTNYRVEIEFDGLSLPVFSFRPNSDLVIECNLAPILRTLLTLNDVVADRLMNTYVKYQAVWEESSDAQVDLSGDVIYFYTGYNNRLNSRSKYYIDNTDGLFLVPTSKLYAWEGYTAYLEFLSDITNSPATKHLILDADSGYPSIFLDYQMTTGKILAQYTFDPTGFNMARVATFAAETAFSSSNATAWPLDSLDKYSQRFVAVTGTRYFRVSMKRVGNPEYTSITFKIVANNAGSPNLSDVKATYTITDFTAIQDTEVDVFLDFGSFTFVNGTTYHLVVEAVDVTTDGSNYIAVYSAASSTYASGTFLSYFGGVWTDETVDMKGGFFTALTEIAALPIEVSEPCNNPIYLKWHNDLGGISTWLFDRDQFYTFDPQPLGRFTRKRIIAGPLRNDMWEAFQELTKAGEELGDNTTFGKYIVDVTDEDNPINVIVEPEGMGKRTKAPRGFVGFNIRYPQLDNMGL